MLEDIIRNSMDRMAPEEGDYQGEDGLLYCGKCGQRKEKRIEVPRMDGEGSRILIVGVQCRCRAEEEHRRQEEERVNHEAERKSNSLMDPAFKECYFTEFRKTKENEENYSICRNYAHNFEAVKAEGYGLMMCGPCGVGKTYAASCIANEVLGAGHSVLFTSMARILSMIESSRQSETEILERIRTAELVVLDDVGAERGTSYAAEKLFSVIDTRYRSKRPLIVTTNISIQDMMQEPDLKYQRSYDRLFEMCMPMTWIGKNWRRNNYQEHMNNMKAVIFGETRIPFEVAL